MYLSRDDILKADDRKTREVEVPEWGGTVLVRALSGTDRDAYQTSLMEFRETGAIPELSNITAKLVARSVIDDDGNLVFTELDIGVLGQKSGAALDRVFKVAAELSGISQQDVEAAMGNSDAAPSGDSTSN